MPNPAQRPATPDDEQAILARTGPIDGLTSLTCTAAHELAEELGLDLTTVGAVCQKHQIKIRDCQLGCFGKFRRA